MFEFTHNNHYQFAYNGIPFVYRNSTYDKFSCSIGKCGGPAGDWRFENQRAARLIYSKARPGQRIKLFYSGGIDSEIMLMAFMDAGVPFDCVIIDLCTNQHDIEYAYKFCASNSINYRTIKIDPATFVKEQQHYFFNDRYQVKQLAMMIVMRVLDILHNKDDIYILGGEIFLNREPDINKFYASNDGTYSYKWYHTVREDNDISYFKYALSTGTNLISEFFCYTPEQIYSYLTDPLVTDLVTDKIDYKYSLMSTKPKVYARYYNFEDRPKYHGYENVMFLNNKVYLDLGENADIDHDTIYLTEVNELIKRLQYDQVTR
jgi:hypothetical protein